MTRDINRRQFIRQSTVAAAATGALLSHVGAVHSQGATGAGLVIGDGEYRYSVQHNWPQLPDQYTWQTTHNVAVDKGGNLYVIHEGRKDQKDHPSIFVFDPAGKFIRAFGSQFQGGGHGLEVRNEKGEEFLYVTGYQHLKTFAKMSLKGDIVWQQFAPMGSGAYAENEDTKPTGDWGRNRFMPTNFAFLPDGGFFLADGYGSFLIHRYDAEGKWVSCFGGAGEGMGKFNTPHGLWIDARGSGEPTIMVTDRAHDTLQRFSLDGKYIETLTGFGLPANVDTFGDLMVIPELKARVSLIGKDNQVVARLGDDVERIMADNAANKGFKIRGEPSQWQDGKFVHPHDACFDAAGNIYVAEWVGSGRVTKLTRV